MKLIDGHCHLTDSRMKDDLINIIRRANEKSIEYFVQGGIEPDEWQQQKQLQQSMIPGLICCFGLHPCWISSQSTQNCEEALLKLKSELQFAKALGEIGLDFRKKVIESSSKSVSEIQNSADQEKEKQIYFFRKQLEIGVEQKMPLVLHVVHAHEDALQVLRNFAPFSSGGIVHAFGGSYQLAQEYVRLGFSISVGGLVTDVRNKKLQKCVQQIPASHLVLETDSPDQPPLGLEGQFNEPTSIFIIAKSIAELRKTSIEDILQISRDNLQKIFHLEIDGTL